MEVKSRCFGIGEIIILVLCLDLLPGRPKEIFFTVLIYTGRYFSSTDNGAERRASRALVNRLVNAEMAGAHLDWGCGF
jgi:hypothetical protein